MFTEKEFKDSELQRYHEQHQVRLIKYLLKDLIFCIQYTLRLQNDKRRNDSTRLDIESSLSDCQAILDNSRSGLKQCKECFESFLSKITDSVIDMNQSLKVRYDAILERGKFEGLISVNNQQNDIETDPVLRENFNLISALHNQNITSIIEILNDNQPALLTKIHAFNFHLIADYLLMDEALRKKAELDQFQYNQINIDMPSLFEHENTIPSLSCVTNSINFGVLDIIKSQIANHYGINEIGRDEEFIKNVKKSAGKIFFSTNDVSKLLRKALEIANSLEGKHVPDHDLIEKLASLNLYKRKDVLEVCINSFLEYRDKTNLKLFIAETQANMETWGNEFHSRLKRYDLYDAAIKKKQGQDSGKDPDHSRETFYKTLSTPGSSFRSRLSSVFSSDKKLTEDRLIDEDIKIYWNVHVKKGYKVEEFKEYAISVANKIIKGNFGTSSDAKKITEYIQPHEFSSSRDRRILLANYLVDWYTACRGGEVSRSAFILVAQKLINEINDFFNSKEDANVNEPNFSPFLSFKTEGSGEKLQQQISQLFPRKQIDSNMVFVAALREEAYMVLHDSHQMIKENQDYKAIGLQSCQAIQQYSGSDPRILAIWILMQWYQNSSKGKQYQIPGQAWYQNKIKFLNHLLNNGQSLSDANLFFLIPENNRVKSSTLVRLFIRLLMVYQRSDFPSVRYYPYSFPEEKSLRYDYDPIDLLIEHKESNVSPNSSSAMRKSLAAITALRNTESFARQDDNRDDEENSKYFSDHIKSNTSLNNDNLSTPSVSSFPTSPYAGTFFHSPDASPELAAFNDLPWEEYGKKIAEYLGFIFPTKRAKNSPGLSWLNESMNMTVETFYHDYPLKRKEIFLLALISGYCLHDLKMHDSQKSNELSPFDQAEKKQNEQMIQDVVGIRDRLTGFIQGENNHVNLSLKGGDFGNLDRLKKVIKKLFPDEKIVCSPEKSLSKSPGIMRKK